MEESMEILEGDFSSDSDWGTADVVGTAVPDQTERPIEVGPTKVEKAVPESAPTEIEPRIEPQAAQRSKLSPTKAALLAAFRDEHDPEATWEILCMARTNNRLEQWFKDTQCRIDKAGSIPASLRGVWTLDEWVNYIELKEKMAANQKKLLAERVAKVQELNNEWRSTMSKDNMQYLYPKSWAIYSIQTLRFQDLPYSRAKEIYAISDKKERNRAKRRVTASYKAELTAQVRAGDITGVLEELPDILWVNRPPIVPDR